MNDGTFYPFVRKSKIKRFFLETYLNEHMLRLFRIEGPCSDIYILKNNSLYISTLINKIKYIFIRSYIFRKVFLPVIDEYFQPYYENYVIKTLKEMNKIVEEKYNSKLTIIVWNEYVKKSFIKRLKETNLDFIFLDENFIPVDNGYRIKDDGHPTAKANKEIAQILYNHINGLE